MPSRNQAGGCSNCCGDEEGCDVCLDRLSPSFLGVSIGPVGGGLELEDDYCTSCLSITDDYILSSSIYESDPCHFHLDWCQCTPHRAPAQGGNPSISATIQKSGDDVLLTVTFSVGLGLEGAGDIAIYNKTIEGAAGTYNCEEIDETLDFDAAISNLNGLCANWEQQEVFLTSVSDDPSSEFFQIIDSENRSIDCPYCVWGSNADIMEVRFLAMGDSLWGFDEECECSILEDWIALRKTGTGWNIRCCYYIGSVETLSCVYFVQLYITDTSIQLTVSISGATVYYQLELEYPHPCQQAFTLTYDGSVPHDALCSDEETATPEIRPIQSSFRFNSFSSGYAGTVL